jgi:hypothetical protein
VKKEAKMNKQVVLILVGLIHLTGIAYAGASTNYDLSWHVIGGGGCEMTSASYAMQSTVGQTAIGVASDGYTIEAGYWYRTAGGESEVCGDVNRDDVVTAADAVIALEIAAGSRPNDPAADVDGDGRVTALDALMILQAAVGGIGL